MLKSLDIKGVVEVSLLLIFGLSINKITEFIHSEMNIIDNVNFDVVLDYSIKVAVLGTAIIKGIIELRKLRSRKDKKSDPEK